MDLQQATSRHREIYVEDTGVVVLMDADALASPTAHEVRAAGVAFSLEGEDCLPTTCYTSTLSALARLVADVGPTKFAIWVPFIALVRFPSTELRRSQADPLLVIEETFDEDSAAAFRGAPTSMSECRR